MSYTDEVAKRRTFAIISHPDSGKTTLTEKLLLYGGVVNTAGSVSAKKNQRSTSSDWMELERQRGISVSSTVLNFDYNGYKVNLLDTPGHKDFSEDTYRTLMAADSVIMLIDNAKGVETQTRKLFEVCRRRGIPLVTFINKMDRFGREPLELIDELEDIFGIPTYPCNWPIGSGVNFQGVYDRREKELHLFQRTQHGSYKAPLKVTDIHDESLKEIIPPHEYEQFLEELEILDGAGHAYDYDAYRRGEQNPVFFGSAVTNFGISQFLHHFLPMAPAPSARETQDKDLIQPDDKNFTGYIFKIQANMDPKHRDCVAFLRVCSGRFERDMSVKHVRTGKTVRLTHSYKIVGQDRETVDDGYAGDIVGFSSNKGLFAIGDTVSDGPDAEYVAIPPFPPEVFAKLRNKDTAKYKQYTKGLEQLSLEGAIQIINLKDSFDQSTTVLAAVGQLQFEVAQYRLESEYGVATVMDPMPELTHARWISGKPEDLDELRGVNVQSATDSQGRLMALFKGEWAMEYTIKQYPKIGFHTSPLHMVNA